MNIGKSALDEIKSHEMYQILSTGKERMELNAELLRIAGEREKLLLEVKAKRIKEKETEIDKVNQRLSSTDESKLKTKEDASAELLQRIGFSPKTQEKKFEKKSEKKSHPFLDMKEVQEQSFTVGFLRFNEDHR